MSVISLTALPSRVWTSVFDPPVAASVKPLQLPVVSRLQVCWKLSVPLFMPVCVPFRRPALHFRQTIDGVVRVELVEIGGAGHKILPPLAIAGLIVAVAKLDQRRRRAAGLLPQAVDDAAEAVEIVEYSPVPLPVASVYSTDGSG